MFTPKWPLFLTLLSLSRTRSLLLMKIPVSGWASPGIVLWCTLLWATWMRASRPEFSMMIPWWFPSRGVAHDPQRAAPGICDATDVDAGVAEPAGRQILAHLDRTAVEDVDPVLGALGSTDVADDDVVHGAGSHELEVHLGGKRP